MIRIISHAALLLVLGVVAGAAEPTAHDGCTLRSATGICQAGPDVMKRFADAASWDRQDFSWSLYEPKRGDYQDAYLSAYADRVIAARAQGYTILPMIGFGVAWAAERTATYAVGDKRRLVLQSQSDDAVSQQDTRLAADGTWHAGPVEQIHDLTKLPIAASHVAEWVDAVRRITTRLMAPDCGLTYFQIWNEAHPDSGFWHGDLTTYIQRIHLPAAKAIHALGGKVVYGGWPCCGSLEGLVDLLDRTDAWGSIDVIDVHYFSVDAYRFLHDAALKRGHHLGIWQTEIGFTTETTFAANVYPRFLQWALGNGATADAYKMFFFAAWSPDDPKAYGYGRTLMSGGTVSAHGLCLQTLGSLFGRSALGPRPGVTSMPALTASLNEKASSLESFTVGANHIVIAIHLMHHAEPGPPPGNSTHAAAQPITADIPEIALTIADLSLASIATVERVSARGTRTDITASARAAAGGIALRVSTTDADVTDAASRTDPVVVYVSIHLK